MAGNYKVRSSGGRFKGISASDLGLSAQAKQRKIHIDALKIQAQQQKERDTEQGRLIEQKGAKEVKNAQFLRGLEVDLQATERKNIEIRAQTEIDSIRGQAAEARRKSQFFQQLAPQYSGKLLQGALALNQWADNRAAHKAFRQNTKLPGYFDDTVEEILTAKADTKAFQNVSIAIKDGKFDELPMFVGIQLSKSENKGNLAVEKYNSSPELFEQSFKANLKPGDLTPETAIELRVEYTAKFLADAGVHPNTRAAQRLFDKQIALGTKERQGLLDKKDGLDNNKKIQEMYDTWKGSRGTKQEESNLNTLVLAIGGLKRMGSDRKIIYPNPAHSWADMGELTADYMIDSMKSGEYASLNDLLERNFNQLIPTGKDGIKPTENWYKKHGKRYDRALSDKFAEKNKEFTLKAKQNDLIITNKTIADIDLITTDPTHENYVNLEDYTENGGRIQFGKFLDTLPKGSKQREYGASKLSINPRSHDSIAFITKLEHFSKYDHAGFVHIWSGLGDAERKKLSPLFERVQYMIEGKGTLKEIEARTKEVYKTLSGIRDSTSSLDESAIKAMDHTVNKVLTLALENYDPNEKPSNVVNNAFKDAIADVIDGKGVYELLEPSDTEPGSGQTRKVYKYFSDIHNRDYSEGWTENELNNYLTDSVLSYEALTGDAGLKVIIGEKSLVSAAKDVDDGRGFTYPKNVKLIAKKFNIPEWRVMNSAFKNMGFSQRVLPDLQAFLEWKSKNHNFFDWSQIPEQDYLPLNTYLDIINITKDDYELSFQDKIPMREEIKKWFDFSMGDSRKSINDFFEAIAVEKNQTPEEQIKTRRQFANMPEEYFTWPN